MGGCRSLARDGAHHVAEQWHILPGILHKWVEVYPVNPAAVHGEYLRDITKREQTANYLVHCSSAARERGSCHHRDLRRALTRSALEILSEAGVVGLSLRAAARRAKVSAMASYRHFADKEALLAAVAEYGFQLLEARLTTATATAADPRAGLAALGVAYVLFARDEPSLFKLMFGPAIEKKSAHPALDQAGYACFDALRQAVEAARFFDNEPDLNDVSLACWSLVHGLSALIVDGRLAENGPGPPEAIATRLTRLLVGALAALADAKPTAAGSNSAETTTERRRPTRSTPKKTTTMIGKSADQCFPK